MFQPSPEYERRAACPMFITNATISSGMSFIHLPHLPAARHFYTEGAREVLGAAKPVKLISLLLSLGCAAVMECEYRMCIQSVACYDSATFLCHRQTERAAHGAQPPIFHGKCEIMYIRICIYLKVNIYIYCSTRILG